MVRMDENMPFLLQYENVAWYDNGKVRILAPVFSPRSASWSARIIMRSRRPSPTW